MARRENSISELCLKVISGDFRRFLGSAEWLKTPEAKSKQTYYDFLVLYDSFCEKRKKYGWSKEVMLSYGIDFTAVKKLKHDLQRN